MLHSYHNLYNSLENPMLKLQSYSKNTNTPILSISSSLCINNFSTSQELRKFSC